MALNHRFEDGINRLIGYNGRKDLRAENEVLEYTVEQEEELEKCLGNPLYFIKTYVKIVHVDIGFIPFVPYKFQENIIETIHNNRFTIGKLPRQTGKTTTVASYILWYVLFNSDKTVAILANKASTAREILSRIQKAYEALPKFVQQGVKTWNKGSIELVNGSKIIADATSSSAIRGRSISLLLIDEMAHIEAHIAEEFFTATYPTISSGKETKVILISTPKGLNLFYEIWMKSVKGKNEYKRIDVHWSEVPGRDEAWFEEQIRNTSEVQVAQEVLCVAGDTLVEVQDQFGVEMKMTIVDLWTSLDFLE